MMPHPILPLALAALAAAGCAAVPLQSGTVSSRAATAIVGCPVPADAAALRAGMLLAVNARRGAAGLAPLRPSAALEQAATIVACDNAERGRMTHVTRQGADLRSRLRAQGYAYGMAAEALGHGYPVPERLAAAWAASAYHRPTLMTPAAQDAGIAVVQAPNGSPWWAMISAQSR